jgi:hypothetical protein
MTLDALLALQRRRNAGHVHLVDLGRHDFRVAHTDDERAAGTNTESCPVHRWLWGLRKAPAPDGVYVVHDHMPDAYSEPYGAAPYDLLPLELADLDAFPRKDPT